MGTPEKKPAYPVLRGIGAGIFVGMAIGAASGYRFAVGRPLRGLEWLFLIVLFYIAFLISGAFLRPEIDRFFQALAHKFVPLGSHRLRILRTSGIALSFLGFALVMWGSVVALWLPTLFREWAFPVGLWVIVIGFILMALADRAMKVAEKPWGFVESIARKFAQLGPRRLRILRLSGLVLSFLGFAWVIYCSIGCL